MSSRTTKATMNELKLRRLLEHNHYLKEELARPRLPISAASIDLIAYCRENKDPLIHRCGGRSERARIHMHPHSRPGAALMQMPPVALEYEEEDLFGSDDEVNPAQAIEERSLPLHSRPPASRYTASADVTQPVAGPSRAPALAGPSSGRATDAYDARHRRDELRQRRVPPPPQTGRGPCSLKDLAMAVIRANALRIFDIGDVEYSTIAPFINELPRDHLAEIEDASPHIKKDTDWLWEYWLLVDYPLFYEQCKDRKGAHRSSGWRRMYKASPSAVTLDKADQGQKAKEDVEERKAQAEEKMAQRYREIEEQKASKRIVQIDRMGPSKKRRLGGPKPPGGSAASQASFSTAPRSAAGAIARAKVEVQRTRLALTHATGRYIPPPPGARPKPPQGTPAGALAHNPFLAPAARHGPPGSSASASAPRATPVAGPRIPAPRSLNKARPAGLLPGAYRADNINEVRTALPEHLHGIAKAQSPRDKVDHAEKPPARPLSGTARKFEVPSFKPPGAQEEKRPKVNFFGKPLAPTVMSKPAMSSGRPRPSGASNQAAAPKPVEKDLSSILFRKRTKPKPAVRPS